MFHIIYDFKNEKRYSQLVRYCMIGCKNDAQRALSELDTNYFISGNRRNFPFLARI